MPATDAELKNLLKCTLEDMYGVNVWWNRGLEPQCVFHIRAGGKEARVSRREIEAVQTNCKGFLDLLKKKLDL